MLHLLFVYGTLLQPGNAFADHLARHCRFLYPAAIRGTLYDLGEYPGLIIHPNDTNKVTGNVYEVDDEVLKLIDDYEGYGEDEDQPNLYVRDLLTIETNRSATDAWVYIYNHPVNGMQIIASGDYLQYLSQKKSPGL